jgi:hypothetical protein
MPLRLSETSSERSTSHPTAPAPETAVDSPIVNTFTKLGAVRSGVFGARVVVFFVNGLRFQQTGQTPADQAAER